MVTKKDLREQAQKLQEDYNENVAFVETAVNMAVHAELEKAIKRAVARGQDKLELDKNGIIKLVNFDFSIVNDLFPNKYEEVIPSQNDVGLEDMILTSFKACVDETDFPTSTRIKNFGSTKFEVLTFDLTLND